MQNTAPSPLHRLSRVRCPQPWPCPTSHVPDRGAAETASAALHRTRLLQWPRLPPAPHKLHVTSCAVFCGSPGSRRGVGADRGAACRRARRPWNCNLHRHSRRMCAACGSSACARGLACATLAPANGVVRFVIRGCRSTRNPAACGWRGAHCARGAATRLRRRSAIACVINVLHCCSYHFLL